MDTGPVRKTIAERGSLESANAAHVTSPIEGQTTIRSIVPEGTKVKEGELICELDVSALRDQLVNQEITTGQAKADLTQVRKTHEVAEMAVREYLEGTYPIKEQKLEDRLALAKSERAVAGEILKHGQEANADELIVMRAKIDLQRAENELHEAESKLKVMKTFQNDRRVKELQAKVETARAEMLALQAAFDLEQSKVEKLSAQIESGKLYAPRDGVVAYPSEPAPAGRGRAVDPHDPGGGDGPRTADPSQDQ